MTKEKFKLELSKSLIKRGYLLVPLRIPEAQLIFYKKEGDLILTLGIEGSKLYKESFTGTYYLAPMFSWGYTPPTFPEKAYERIGSFLKKEERKKLLSPEFVEKGIVDAWWRGYSEENIEKFSEAVGLTEKRFLQQKNLKNLVLNSADIIEDFELINKIVKKNNDNGMSDVNDYKEYYNSVKKVIASNKEKYSIWDNRNGIEFLAQNAWAIANL